MFEKHYLKLSMLFPQSIVAKASVLLIQAGYSRMPPRLYVGFVFFFSLCMGLFFFFISPYFMGPSPLLSFLALVVGFIVSIGAFYFILLNGAESKAKKIEQVLPSVLQIISANIRAGMTLENAIWSAARPEFGIFRDEISRVSADTFGGQPITTSLLNMSRRVRSDTLNRAMRLIAQGIHLGGEMAQLLNEVAGDIRSTQILKREIAASTMMYVIFIVFASVLISPILFSVSVFYAQMNEHISQKKSAQLQGQQMSGTSPAGSLGGLSAMGLSSQARSEDLISSQDIWWFALASIMITTFFGAIILSIIQTGNWTGGIKIAPIFMVAALAIFIVSQTVLNSLLGDLFI
ncbi:MAG: type II secretion system F family protein [Candidatus Micrarchaeota archaeon]